jgi:heavy metal sensor kinase
MRWIPRSVRMRLTIWYALTLCLSLVVYALFVYAMLWRMLSADLDAQLKRDIVLAEQMLEFEDGVLVWDTDNPNSDNNLPRIEVRSKEGVVLYCSPKYKSKARHDDRIMHRTVRIEGFAPAATIHAARSEDPMKDELEFLMLVLALGVPLVVALAGGGGYVLARRALAPVDRMTSQARAVTAENLSERLTVENKDDELGRLGVVFNDMFERLERSFEELRRFTADASHEMRTPLAVIRSVGEVGLDRPRSAEEYREIVGSMLEETDRLSRLVDSLLTLSRTDSGRVKLKREPSDLRALAEQVASQLGVLAEEKGQTLRIEGVETLETPVDPAILRRAIVNILENAIKYSPDESTIRIVVLKKSGFAVLEVIDQGPGIAPEHRERIFDRFFRIDKARSRQIGGTGLGLAIARWAVDIHGGNIEVESAKGVGSIFRITLPA